MAHTSSTSRVRQEHIWDLVGGPSPFGPAAADDDVAPGATPAPVDTARGKRPLLAGTPPGAIRGR